MPVQVTLSQIAKLAPNARSSYRDAFAAADTVFDRYGISANTLRVAHFMAQILHESGGLTIQFENLNYSAERLPKVWPGRFKPKGPLDPSEFAHNPEKLAEAVYSKRMGNDQPGEGYKYRGRGLLQLTGKDSYKEATEICKKNKNDAPDFVLNPDEAINASWCLEVACAEWQAKGCNELADRDIIRSVTQKINGGLIGLADRQEWLKRTKNIWA
jgi:putative chitinase